MSRISITNLNEAPAPAPAAAVPSPVEQSWMFRRDHLQGWFESLRNINNKAADVLLIGDSTSNGYGMDNKPYLSLANQIRRKGQAEFNPDGVDGGYGLARVTGEPNVFTSSVFAPYNDFELFGSWGARIDGNKTGEIILHCSDSEYYDFDMESSGLQIPTDAEVVFNGGSIYSPFQIDYRDDGGDWRPAQQITPKNSSGTFTGCRAGIVGDGTGAWEDMPLEGVSSRDLRITCTTAVGEYADIAGIILYRRDRGRGFRLYNASHESLYLRNMIPNNVNLNPANTIKGLYNYSINNAYNTFRAYWDFARQDYDLDGYHNKNLALVIIAYGGINEYQGRDLAVNDPDVYLRGLNYICDQIHGWSANASVLLVPWWQISNYQDDVNTLPRWSRYVEAAQVIATHKDFVGALLLDDMVGRTRREGSQTYNVGVNPLGLGMQWGWEQADGIHPNYDGAAAIADAVVKMLALP